MFHSFFWFQILITKKRICILLGLDDYEYTEDVTQKYDEDTTEEIRRSGDREFGRRKNTNDDDDEVPEINYETYKDENSAKTRVNFATKGFRIVIETRKYLIYRVAFK